jgi:hypothetical protein
VRDSYGSSGTDETPEALKGRKEAQRPPRGKRVPALKINKILEAESLLKSNKVYENSHFLKLVMMFNNQNLIKLGHKSSFHHELVYENKITMAIIMSNFGNGIYFTISIYFDTIRQATIKT